MEKTLYYLGPNSPWGPGTAGFILGTILFLFLTILFGGF
jgi:hypothetical protein